MSPLVRHLVRGIVGVLALVGAFVYAPSTSLALLLIPVALVAFGGCPTCWIAGLLDRLRGRAPSCSARGGGCA